MTLCVIANPHKGKEAKLFAMIQEKLKKRDTSYDRCFGCVTGAAIGDSIGSYLEQFTTKDPPTEEQTVTAMEMPGGGLCWNVAPGQVTDDTELANSLARGLHKMIKEYKEGHYNSSHIVKEYVQWGKGAFDVGRCTRSTLGGVPIKEGEKATLKHVKEMKRKAAEYNAGSLRHQNPKRHGNLANGALMRCTPLIVYGRKLSQDQLAQLMAEDASLSHANQIGYRANQTYAIAIQSLLNSTEEDRTKRMKEAFTLAEKWLKGKVEEEKKIGKENAAKVYKWLTRAKNASSTKELQDVNGKDYIIPPFERAFYHLKAGSTFLETIEPTIAEGGDTDTNACIVGGMFGAIDGYTELRKLQSPKEKVEYVKRVVESDLSKGSYPHRKNYHPATFIDNLPTVIDKAPKKILSINQGIEKIPDKDRPKLPKKNTATKRGGNKDGDKDRPKLPKKNTTTRGLNEDEDDSDEYTRESSIIEKSEDEDDGLPKPPKHTTKEHKKDKDNNPKKAGNKKLFSSLFVPVISLVGIGMGLLSLLTYRKARSQKKEDREEE
ncbi:MAG: ADP-ribosylglycohydrolase family protein [Bacteroidota bacterium]